MTAKRELISFLSDHRLLAACCRRDEELDRVMAVHAGDEHRLYTNYILFRMP